jgi:hypothetical protein
VKCAEEGGIDNIRIVDVVNGLIVEFMDLMLARKRLDLVTRGKESNLRCSRVCRSTGECYLTLEDR